MPFYGITSCYGCDKRMLCAELIKELIYRTKEKIYDYIFKIEHRLMPEAFTRNRKLSYEDVILMSLNSFKKTTAVEVNNFFENVLNSEETVTRDAYEKARRKISHTAFQELFEDTSKLSLMAEDSKLYKGFRLSAIDGSTAMLEKSDELKDCFGESTPSKGDIFARISLCVDVLNEVVLDGEIGKFATGEREMALTHIEKGLCDKMLYLFDRGYWSPGIIAKICDKGQKFLMRIASNASKKVRDSKENSGYFEKVIEGKSYTLRFYKFELNSGEMEYLVTNLTCDEVSDEELGDLYFMRWGIESKYYQLKEQLQLENFTGKSVLFILQDFYAMLYVLNMTAFVKLSTDQMITEKHKNKTLKNKGITNHNVALGLLKDRFIRIMIEDDPLKQSQMLDKLLVKISKNITWVRPGRSNPRKKSSLKHRKRTVSKKSV